MTANYGYIKNLPGQLKLLTIVLAGILMLMSFLSHFLSEYTSDREKHRVHLTDNEIRSLWKEWYLVCASTFCFIVSSINLFLHCRSLEFYFKKMTGIYDFIYHCAAALLLGTSGVLFIVSAVRLHGIGCTAKNDCQLFELKFGAGGLSMISSIFFGVVGTLVLTNRRDVERESLMADKPDFN